MSEPRPWHRLFGLTLVDFFRGMPVTVELEKDLAHKQQMLDVVIINKDPKTPLACKLPDGFEDLAAHNLISFKSYQEPLDDWPLDELIGHYVNYRKQVSDSMQNLMPKTDIRLFAVCIRYPQALAQLVPLTRVQDGVYDVKYGARTIRLIVVHQLPEQEHNALLHLFSAQPEQVRYGATHYHLRSNEMTTLLAQLFERYRLEGSFMTDSLEQLARDTIDDILKKMPAQELLKRVSVDERLEGVDAEELRKRLSPEERLEGLPVEELRKRLSPEERLEGLPAKELLKRLSLDELSPEDREALAQRLKDKESPPKPE